MVNPPTHATGAITTPPTCYYCYVGGNNAFTSPLTSDYSGDDWYANSGQPAIPLNPTENIQIDTSTTFESFVGHAAEFVLGPLLTVLGAIFVAGGFAIAVAAGGGCWGNTSRGIGWVGATGGVSRGSRRRCYGGRWFFWRKIWHYLDEEGARTL